ncbi:MAG: helix-turn-helix domain-containing protein [Candidatus Omnitrophica bacterium]|nr:helix-turn-helix domain-containing protein [Candidatus Omnitrophota bacterium]
MMRIKFRKAGVQPSRPRKPRPFIFPGRIVEGRRKFLGWTGVELAKRSGINPRTLDAIEKGRIKSPSLANLEALAEVLEISVASLFVTEELGQTALFSSGDQKGKHILEFPKHGFRIVCYTPMVPHLFAGKVVVKAQTPIEHKVLPTSGSIFVQPIMGKLSIYFDGKDYLIREGNYAFFDGSFPHSFFNPQLKESTFLLITTPSFLSLSSKR